MPVATFVFVTRGQLAPFIIVGLLVAAVALGRLEWVRRHRLHRRHETATFVFTATVLAIVGLGVYVYITTGA